MGGMEDNWRERITITPNILAGRPAIRGMRIGVEMIIEQLAYGWTKEDILRSYPVLTVEDIHACLAYAAAVLDEQGAHPLVVS